MINQNMKHLYRLLVFFDIVMVSMALLLAWYIRIKSGLIKTAAGHLSFYEYMKVIVLILPLYLILYSFLGLYKPESIKSNFEAFFNLIKANLIGILVFLAYLFITDNADYSRLVLLLFFMICMTLCFAERVVFRIVMKKYRKKGFNIKHVVLVGRGELAHEFTKRIANNVQWGYEITGLFDNYTKKQSVLLDQLSVPVIGTISEMEKYLSEQLIDEVIITLPLKEYACLDQVVAICEKTGVFTRIIPDYNKYIPSRPHIEDIDGLPMISIRKVPLNDLALKTIKRVIDVVGSLFGILILLPFLLIITFLVKVTSKGPILYQQTRIGLNRKPFKMYKFRSMVVQKKEDEKKAWTTKDDIRVTKLGKILRKTSIDELPQLINVLRGDMSLVGPRPERPQFVDQFREKIPKYMVKHQVRPGITGWAQVNGWRGDTCINKRIEYDLYYIENWSMSLDIKILIMTIFKGFLNKNAY